MPIITRANKKPRIAKGIICAFLTLAVVNALLAFPVNAQTSQPSPYTSAVRYDIFGRVTGTVSPDPDGSGPLKYAATRTAYDAIGLVVKVESGELASWPGNTAPKNWTGFTILQTEHHAYDTMNRRVKTWVVGSDGATVSVSQFNTDKLGRAGCAAVRMNPAAFSNPPANPCTLGSQGSNGPDRITQNIYDDAGQLLQVRKAVGTPLEQAETTMSYTLNGKQQYVIDANGNRAQMLWDQHDRQTRWIFPSKTAPTSYNDATQATALTTAGVVNNADYESYTYDNVGNRLTFRKRDGSILSYQYDALNRTTRKTVPSRSGLSSTHTRDVFYSYDNRNLQLRARFDSINGEGVTNAYDGFGRMISSQINMSGLNKTLTYTHDKGGNRTRVTHPDGQPFNYVYDNLDRVTNIKRSSSSLATLSYNNRGLQSSLGGGVASSMTYDAVGRLASFTHDLAGSNHDVTFGFGFNPASQIVSRSISDDGYVWTDDVNVNRNYAANGLNQYTSAGPASFTYDANGNLTSDGDSTYVYDIENRLVSASGATTAGLRYDPLGRLFETSGGSAGTTRFHYDGDELIAEYNGSNALVHRYVHGAGVDDPIIWYQGAGVATGDLNRLRADWQGSIVAVTDNGGNAEQLNAYDDWGIPSATNLGRFQYTGQIHIPELDMYHYKARIYSPTLGRFLQTDPIGYEDQYNLYAYVGNDPVNQTDSSGERSDGQLFGDLGLFVHYQAKLRGAKTPARREQVARGYASAFRVAGLHAYASSAEQESKRIDRKIQKLFRNPRTGETRKPSERELSRFAEAQGFKAVRKETRSGGRGPLTFVDENGIARITIKKPSSRTPGSNHHRATYRNADGHFVDPVTLQLVNRKSIGTHRSFNPFRKRR